MKQRKEFRNRGKTIPEEKTLLEIASHYSNLSPHNILVIGGTLTLPEISGYKRMRSRSRDVDFIVNDLGLEAILSSEPTKREEDFNPLVNGGAYITEKNELYAAFFHNEIRGYVIPEEIFSSGIPRETSVGTIYTIPEELNLALKIRRGVHSKGKIYGKDVLDAASMIIGMEMSGREFDAEAFAGYTVNGTCRDASLNQLLGYVSRFMDAVNNIGKEHVETYVSKISECAAYVEEKKMLLDPSDYYSPSGSRPSYTMFDPPLPVIRKDGNAIDPDRYVEDLLLSFDRFRESPGAW